MHDSPMRDGTSNVGPEVILAVPSVDQPQEVRASTMPVGSGDTRSKPDFTQLGYAWPWVR